MPTRGYQRIARGNPVTSHRVRGGAAVDASGGWPLTGGPRWAGGPHRQGLAAALLQAAHSALDAGQRPAATRHVASALAITHETREAQLLARAVGAAAELLAATEPQQAGEPGSGCGQASAVHRLASGTRRPSAAARLAGWRATTARSPMPASPEGRGPWARAGGCRRVRAGDGRRALSNL